MVKNTDTGTVVPTKARAATPVAVAVGGFLAIGVLLFPGAGWDDSYITYWAAHALADFGEIANYNGDRVEQSSSLGLVFVLGVLRWCTGVDVSILGKFASIAFGAATVFATARLAVAASPTADRYAPVIVATSAYFVYWSFSGMETSFVAFSNVLLILVYSYLLQDTTPRVAWLLTIPVSLLYLLSRPEAYLILLSTLMGLAGLLFLRRFWSERDANKLDAKVVSKLVGLIIVAMILIGAIVTFRVAYFGAFSPQPVSAKYRGITKQAILEGVSYVQKNVESDFVILCVLASVAVITVVIPTRWSRQTCIARDLCALFYAASLGFIVVSGGDGMYGGRFFVPTIPAAAVLGVGLIRKVLPSGVLRVAMVCWILAQLTGAFLFARNQSHGDPLWAVESAGTGSAPRCFHWFERANRDHRRYFPAVIELEHHIDLALTKQDTVTIFSGQSGFMMYHVAKTRYGKLRYLDRFGLVTRDFVECPVTAGLRRSAWGLTLYEGFYLKRIDRLRQECGMPPADIVYDLYWGDFAKHLDDGIAASKYRVVYRQTEVYAGNSKLLPGHTVGGLVYILVRPPPNWVGAD